MICGKISGVDLTSSVAVWLPHWHTLFAALYLPHLFCHILFATLYLPHFICHTYLPHLFATIYLSHFICHTSLFATLICHTLFAILYLPHFICHTFYLFSYLILVYRRTSQQPQSCIKYTSQKT